jgi:hypothetical protein
MLPKYIFLRITGISARNMTTQGINLTLSEVAVALDLIFN